MLDALQLATHKLNLHVGWAPGSEQLHRYKRAVVVEEWDRQFFADVLQRA